MRIREGSRLDRIVAARDFNSVAGMLESGLTFTSNVAFDAFSAARRTSIGPDSEARAPVSPVLRNEKRSKGQRIFCPSSPKANRAEPSTRASPSYEILMFRIPSTIRPSRLDIVLMGV